MSYSLEQFCGDARQALERDEGPAGREQVRRALEGLLVDPGFCRAYLGDDSAPGLRRLHEDPEQQFCVLAYNMPADRDSPPHDHGRSWAIYGQVLGYTDMTVWSPREEGEGRIGVEHRFRLEPGQAGLFDVGCVHSISYRAGARFVRITGVNLEQEPRRVFDPETGTVRLIEGVSAGPAR